MSDNPDVGFGLIVRRGHCMSRLLTSFLKTDGAERISLKIHQCSPQALDIQGDLFEGIKSTQSPIPTVADSDNAWGKMKMVEIIQQLLKAAFQDENIKYFVLLSESCVPLFHTAQEFLIALAGHSDNFTKSIINLNKHKTKRADFLLGFPLTGPNNNIKEVVKHSQWIALSRADFFQCEHVVDSIINQFTNQGGCPDEHVYGTVLRAMEIPFISHKQLTYTHWEDHQDHPTTYYLEDNDNLDMFCNLPIVVQTFRPSGALLARKIKPLHLRVYGRYGGNEVYAILNTAILVTVNKYNHKMTVSSNEVRNLECVQYLLAELIRVGNVDDTLHDMIHVYADQRHFEKALVEFQRFAHMPPLSNEHIERFRSYFAPIIPIAPIAPLIPIAPIIPIAAPVQAPALNQAVAVAAVVQPPRSLTSIIIVVAFFQLLLHVIPKHLSHVILPDDNWLSFSCVMKAIGWILLPQALCGHINLQHDILILNIIDRWTTPMLSVCFIVFLKAKLNYSMTVGSELCSVSSAVFGVLVWLSPIDVDVICLQLIASGMFIITICQLGLHLVDWVSVWLFPAAITLFYFVFFYNMLTVGRNNNNGLMNMNVAFLCVAFTVIGMGTAVIVAEEWRIVIFFIADASCALQICKIWD